MSPVSQMNWGKSVSLIKLFFTGDSSLECEGRQALCEVWRNGAKGLNNMPVIY